MLFSVGKIMKSDVLNNQWYSLPSSSLLCTEVLRLKVHISGAPFVNSWKNSMAGAQMISLSPAPYSEVNSWCTPAYGDNSEWGPRGRPNGLSDTRAVKYGTFNANTICGLGSRKLPVNVYLAPSLQRFLWWQWNEWRTPLPEPLCRPLCPLTEPPMCIKGCFRSGELAERTSESHCATSGVSSPLFSNFFLSL